MKKLLTALAIALSTAISPISAIAEDAPACTAKSVGIVHCMAERMCECKFFHASAMAGTPERFGWDCGITRPNCLDFKTIDNSKPYDGPQSVEIDKSKVKVEQH